MKSMPPKIMWAIVDRKTGALAYSDNPYSKHPLLYEEERWAVEVVGRQGRVVKVEIREIR